jgi:hypothetical protein
LSIAVVKVTLVAAPTGCWAAAVHADPPFSEYSTTYPVIAAPPVAGAVHDTTAEALPATADTPVGAPGVVDGTTEELATDTAPVPFTFTADTRNTYPVPFTRFDTT